MRKKVHWWQLMIILGFVEMIRALFTQPTNFDDVPFVKGVVVTLVSVTMVVFLIFVYGGEE